MLLRGQNLIGYKHYDDNFVDIFIKMCIENRIDIVEVWGVLMT